MIDFVIQTLRPINFTIRPTLTSDPHSSVRGYAQEHISMYVCMYIYILVLTCSFNEQGSCGTFCLIVGRGVDVAGMYVENVLSVFCQ